jgi:hypothetical protein
VLRFDVELQRVESVNAEKMAENVISDPKWQPALCGV